MNLNCEWRLNVFLLVGLMGIANGGVRTMPPRENPFPEQEKIVSVPYCDLIKNQAKHTGELVRVRAVVLISMDAASLHDSGCREVGLEPVLDCKDDEECSAMREALNKEIDYNGDVGRVETVLIGRLVVPPDTPSGKSRSKFMIKKIEQTKRISRDIPWPGQ